MTRCQWCAAPTQCPPLAWSGGRPLGHDRLGGPPPHTDNIGRVATFGFPLLATSRHPQGHVRRPRRADPIMRSRPRRVSQGPPPRRAEFSARTFAGLRMRLRPRVSALPRLWVMPRSARRTVAKFGEQGAHRRCARAPSGDGSRSPISLLPSRHAWCRARWMPNAYPWRAGKSEHDGQWWNRWRSGLNHSILPNACQLRSRSGINKRPSRAPYECTYGHPHCPPTLNVGSAHV